MSNLKNFTSTIMEYPFTAISLIGSIALWLYISLSTNNFDSGWLKFLFAVVPIVFHWEKIKNKDSIISNLHKENTELKVQLATYTERVSNLEDKSNS
ncbi:hypothetical protein [Halobacteriovorax marinus]|uniref:hypothetical protein n=1 Tax=Halobacteriovorax marinus TaxID=97084 RepID=UPI003A94F7BB